MPKRDGQWLDQSRRLALRQQLAEPSSHARPLNQRQAAQDIVEFRQELAWQLLAQVLEQEQE
jgi:hypothetical protein